MYIIILYVYIMQITVYTSLMLYNFIIITAVIIIIIFLPTSTKPQAWKLRESIMAATVAHSAIILSLLLFNIIIIASVMLNKEHSSFTIAAALAATFFDSIYNETVYSSVHRV